MTTTVTAGSAEGPAQVAERYFAALASRNGKTVCDVSTGKRRQAFFVAAISLGLPHSTCAQAVKSSEETVGADELAPLKHAKVRVLSESGGRARVQRVGGHDILTMKRIDGSAWLVDTP